MGPEGLVDEKGGLVDRHTGRRVGQYGAGRASEGLKPPGADLEPERAGGDVLQLVGLIEHHQVVGGQHLGARSQGGGVQVGVDHDHIGGQGPFPGRFGEAHGA